MAEFENGEAPFNSRILVKMERVLGIQKSNLGIRLMGKNVGEPFQPPQKAK